MKVELRVSWRGYRPGAVLEVEDELGASLLKHRLATDKIHSSLKPVSLLPRLKKKAKKDDD